MRFRQTVQKSQQSIAIDEIAEVIRWRMILFLFTATVFGLLELLAIIEMGWRNNPLVNPGLFATLACLAIAVFLGKLSKDFRTCKKWAYEWALWLATTGGILGPGGGVRRKLKQDDVLRAFGLQRESSSTDE